ncbi:MAG: oligopeptide/dipeptide ABC transporter ATP-binding protein [Kineosporiaceae bacterium]
MSAPADTLPAPGRLDPRGPAEVLRVEDLHVRFAVRDDAGRKRQLRAVDGVSFSIRRGETLGLVGESGCGKSSLVRTLFGLNPIASGAVHVLGRDLARMPRRTQREVRNRMQLVFQDPYSSLNPRLTAHEIVAEPLRIAGRYSPQRVRELVEAVGLDDAALRRRPSEFSGGQRQRLGIARALALEPDLLVLDEPVSALDVSVQAQVVNLLQELQQRLGLSYLFIAHDLSVVRHISHRVAVMHLGRFVEVGPREQIFGDPRHPYTRALLSAIPLPDPRLRDRPRVTLRGELPDATRLPAGCSFAGRCPVAQPDCADTDPALEPSSAPTLGPGDGPAEADTAAVACLHPDLARERIPVLSG